MMNNEGQGTKNRLSFRDVLVKRGTGDDEWTEVSVKRVWMGRILPAIRCSFRGLLNLIWSDTHLSSCPQLDAHCPGPSFTGGDVHGQADGALTGEEPSCVECDGHQGKVATLFSCPHPRRSPERRRR